jgi:hypothetical protein
MRISSRIAALLIVAQVFLPRTVFAQRKDAGPERMLFDSANRERTAQGLPPLQWDAALTAAARQHALRMARENSLSHQFSGEKNLSARAMQAGARFSAIAENVAEGPSAANIHAQWMKSPPHRGNLLDPQLDSVGIAVTQRNGQLFAVEDFSQALADLSLGEQERQLAAELEACGLRLRNHTADARRTCGLERGYIGGHPPRLPLELATSLAYDSTTSENSRAGNPPR